MAPLRVPASAAQDWLLLPAVRVVTARLLASLLLPTFAPQPALADRLGWGVEGTYKDQEYVPALHVLVAGEGWRVDGCANFTTIAHDPYNGGHPEVSLTGTASLALFAVAGFFQPEYVGQRVSVIASWIAIGPIVLTNSQLHLMLVDGIRARSPRPWSLSVFLSTRTDYFGGWTEDATDWIRYSPGAGMQVLVLGQSRDPGGQRSGMALHVGVDRPYDFVSFHSCGWGDFRLFAGLQWTGLFAEEPSDQARGRPSLK